MMFGISKAISVGVVLSAMAAMGQGAAPAGAAPAAPAASGPAMGLLQPAVMNLQQTMDILRVDKWKTSKEVKAATMDNVGSIRRDVEGTLPGLVTAADAAPNSVAAMLPLNRNLGALYDVVLRVTVIAESAAPGDQADALEKSLTGLESARKALADRLASGVAAEEAKVGDLQKQLNARPAVAAVCPPVAVAAAPEKTTKPTVRRRKKTIPKKKPAEANPAASGPS
jgi:hypothetical protein